jgi:two-component system cell cycle sensor histidine kinase/response regulator CckA
VLDFTSPVGSVSAGFLSAFLEGTPQHTPAATALLDSLPQAVVLFDTNEKFAFANVHAREMFKRRGFGSGASISDFKSSIEMFAPGSQTPVSGDRSPARRALRGESVQEEQYRFRNKTRGSVAWLEMSAVPVRNGNGNICGAALLCRDITERKNRELAIKSEDELRTFIYEGNLAGILHTTVDGRIVNCNSAIVRMLGYSSAEELKSIRADRNYFNPADREKLLRDLRVAGHLDEYEIRFRRRDNTPCWVLVNVRFLDSPNDVGGTLIAAVIDITERKRSEEILRRSQLRFEAFMRNLPGIAFIKDAAGRYLYYNAACAKLFGKTASEFIGQTDHDLWPDEIASVYTQNDATVRETGRPLEVTEQVPQGDEMHSWLISKFPMTEPGEPVLIGGIGIDITERQTLEEQLTTARKMEALGRLAGGVAHDFNNLLTIISGYGQLSLEGLKSGSTERLSSYIHEILASSQRAAGLTNQLLAFSRRQPVETRLLDLSEVLKSFERLLQRTLGEHIALAVQVAPEPCLIMGDENQIEQVLMNLAVNARDAMPLGGTLDVSSHILREPGVRPVSGPVVMVEFRDTGIGMDDDVKARLFEPFFTSKEKARGTGLGLSTAYGIVKQGGGDIEVESTPGEGTVFRLYFPLKEGSVARPAPATTESAPSGLETVLLVEDESAVRALVETILKGMGYTVLTADGGQAALEVWKKAGGAIDILLTDVIMPQMSGGELAHRLRDLKPELKILFMSGYTDDMLASHRLFEGETQLIQKPFSAEQLGRKLRDVLDA